MKVTNWLRKITASLIAGGALAPAMCYAVDIPLGDPSFDLYVVPAATGYAYAVPPNGSYRPTSAWVDDLDSPPGFSQDAGSSNWIYNAAYAASARPTPRTGNQAMHGLDGNYNAQETTALFEAGKTYTFSLWAQNDVLLDQGDGVGLYIFNGNVPFSAANSLAGMFTQTINQRTASMTAAQSQANWGLLSVNHTVLVGAPEIGAPVGVAFRAFRDSAVDDARLQVDDAATQTLVLEVNTVNGQMRMRNQTGADVRVDYYEITSGNNALNSAGWDPIATGTPVVGFPQGNGSGNGWETAGGSSPSVLSESYVSGNSNFTAGQIIGLGAGFNVGGQQQLTFKYGEVASSPVPAGDYNNNLVVDAADYVLWRNGGPLFNDPTPGVQPGDYDVWKANFGRKGGFVGAGVLKTGFVRYVTSFSGSGSSLVPEPSSVILVGVGIAVLAVGNRRRLDADCE